MIKSCDHLFLSSNVVARFSHCGQLECPGAQKFRDRARLPGAPERDSRTQTARKGKVCVYVYVSVSEQSFKIRPLEQRYFLLADVGALPSMIEVGIAPLERPCVCSMRITGNITSIEWQCNFTTSIHGRIHVAYLLDTFSVVLCFSLLV